MATFMDPGKRFVKKLSQRIIYNRMSFFMIVLRIDTFVLPSPLNFCLNYKQTIKLAFKKSKKPSLTSDVTEIRNITLLE